MNAARHALPALALACILAGCEATPEAASLARRNDLDTPGITHVVLVQLKDPSRTAELVADCDRALPGIPGVAGYSCGVPLDMGRSNVSGDYDVGIYVGFRGAAEYRAYLEDPGHLALVERWREGWKAVRIFDVVEGVAAAAPVDRPATPPSPAAAPGNAPSQPAPPAAVPQTSPTPGPSPTAAPAPAKP
jgi:hypothetical protein